jgi:hypothetical protein
MNFLKWIRGHKTHPVLVVINIQIFHFIAYLNEVSQQVYIQD